MWNKREDESVRPPTAAPQAVLTSGAVATRRDAPAGIGPSISIVGDITGDEDLTILGKVKGKIDLPRHDVTVGESGKVDADVHAKVVSVAGEVRGNLFAGEQILIRRTATMLGNLTAPRVGLEDGCCFRGSVEMETPEKGRAASAQPARAPATLAPVKPSGSALQAPGSPGSGIGSPASGMPAKPEVPPVRP
jgi:cytoskeletal protein CcmA (bactofilin family)